MKLRIKGNSIRLRLGQSEVQRLAADGIVEESTTFGPTKEQCLGYALCKSSESPDIHAIFGNRRIVVYVPSSVIYEWVTSDQISIQAIQTTGDDAELRILIEKDFECIDAAPGESQEDAFPNPQLSAACLPAGDRST
jgi:hypothetical protein